MDYGCANDVTVMWSSRGVLRVVAILSDRSFGGYDTQPSEALVASAAKGFAQVPRLSAAAGPLTGIVLRGEYSIFGIG